MKLLDKLATLKASGTRQTTGLADADIERLGASHPDLVKAIEQASSEFNRLSQLHPDLMRADEAAQAAQIQAGFINFYPDDAVNPYVALAAKGPWVISSKGAVIHDSGGYGMLGFGHDPSAVVAAMSQGHVMANIMTPSFSQLNLNNALRKEVGQKRGGCPYEKFICLNSGSESVTLAARLSDVNAKQMTDAGGRHAGKQVKILALKGAFHGRTERPAQFSDSSRKTYQAHLATFRGLENLLTVPANDVEALREVFAQADANNWFIEAMFVEPVMGEGNPGMGITPAFYQTARELTAAHGSVFLVDSIQAGLRAHGYLSIVDYPGFEKLPAPDMETYSKALNAGQFPLSVLAVNTRVAELYRKGLYGNTMTTNPRALDVACAVMSLVDDKLRSNIQIRGKEFVEKLQKLATELPGLITKVQGTGLLLSCELSKDFKCYGNNSTEEYLRLRGIGVIHGGVNSLRFTPHFNIQSDEIDLVVGSIKDALVNGPRLAKSDAQVAA